MYNIHARFLHVNEKSVGLLNGVVNNYLLVVLCSVYNSACRN